MINTSFEKYKLSREIEKSGRSFIFFRKAKNQFKEETRAATFLFEKKGLYHEVNSRVSVTLNDTTKTQTKKQPAIMFLYDELQGFDLQIGDYTVLGGRKLYVTGVVNVQEWNICIDVSLEEGV